MPAPHDLHLVPITPAMSYTLGTNLLGLAQAYQTIKAHNERSTRRMVFIMAAENTLMGATMMQEQTNMGYPLPPQPPGKWRVFYNAWPEEEARQVFTNMVRECPGLAGLEQFEYPEAAFVPVLICVDDEVCLHPLSRTALERPDGEQLGRRPKILGGD